MTQRIKAVVRYDGTDYSGWQVQPGRSTVQGVIEKALSAIAGEPISIHCAGRTDAGVHALAQVFHADWNGRKGLDELRRSLSQMLAPAIRIESIVEAPGNFHARYAAQSKRYVYVFSTTRESDPFSARYAWRVPSTVEAQTMRELAQLLVGRHDFAGFTSSGSSVANTERTVFSIVTQEGPLVGVPGNSDHWRIEFHGTGFLYKMIRNIVGTLTEVARGKSPEKFIHERLQSKGPYEGFTAPARGLFLTEIDYKGNEGHNEETV